MGMSSRQVVGGEVDRIEVEIEEVGAAGQVEGAGRQGLRMRKTEALGEEVVAEGTAEHFPFKSVFARMSTKQVKG
jgi:hypothetical protein